MSETPTTTGAGKATPEAVPAAKGRHFLNLTLLGGIFLLLTFWYDRHMQYRVAGLVVGGVMGVWMLWRILYDLLKWGAGDEVKALPKRVLGSARTTAVLLVGLPLSALLHGVTSSLHLQAAAGTGREQVFRVEVQDERRDRALLENVKVTGDRAVEGRPFWFRGGGARVRVRLIEPVGYAPLTTNLGWGRRVFLTVPTDFSEKTLHLLRLIPGPKLLSALARPGDPVLTRYDVVLVRAGQTNVIEDWRQGVACTGATRAEMEAVLKRETAAARRADFEERLGRLGFPAAGREAVLRVWEGPPRLEDSGSFEVGDGVAVSVRRGGEALVFGASVRIEPERRVHTLLIEL
jgi:hypothetical protein